LQWNLTQKVEADVELKPEIQEFVSGLIAKMPVAMQAAYGPKLFDMAETFTTGGVDFVKEFLLAYFDMLIEHGAFAANRMAYEKMATQDKLAAWDDALGEIDRMNAENAENIKEQKEFARAVGTLGVTILLGFLTA
jgi:hypothetical protein